jgi:hypothetical protein
MLDGRGQVRNLILDLGGLDVNILSIIFTQLLFVLIEIFVLHALNIFGTMIYLN